MAQVPLKIRAMGKALPSTRVTSLELDRRLGKPDGYVQRRSGIEYRHMASKTDSQAELGAQALAHALRNASLTTHDIDLLLNASAIPVQALPCTATHILQRARLPDGTPGFDVNLSCASFVAALHVASGLLQLGLYRRIAIVSAELASRGMNWEDEGSSYLFGDGAACAIVEQGDGKAGILAARLESHVQEGDFCEIRAGGTRCNPHTTMQETDFYFHMQGARVFKMAKKYINAYQERLLADAGMTLEDVDLVIPHQGSHLGIKHIHKQLGIPTEKLMDIYATHGNQIAASIPIALYEALEQGRCRGGDTIMLLATAASISYAGMILKI